LTLKKFFILSIIVHGVIILCVYFLPVTSEQKPREFFASLVTPETREKPAIPIPESKQKPDKKSSPSQEISRPRPKEIEPPRQITPESPDVPGEGKDSGIPLPKEVSPGAVQKKEQTKDSKVTSKPLPAKPEKPAPEVPSTFPSESGKGIEGPDVKRTERPGPGEGVPGKKPSPGISLRQKLFDPGVTEEIAKRDSGRAVGRTGKKNEITFDTSDYRYVGYMSKLRAKIENIWIYPPEARERGIYGDLKIRFTIRKDGTLGEVELVRTSGYKMLDEAAMKALKEGEPYWPLPDAWGMDSYTILGHFIYNLYGYRLQ